MMFSSHEIRVRPTEKVEKMSVPVLAAVVIVLFAIAIVLPILTRAVAHEAINKHVVGAVGLALWLATVFGLVVTSLWLADVRLEWYAGDGAMGFVSFFGGIGALGSAFVGFGSIFEN